MSYERLLAIHREITALSQARSALQWDQEVMMPSMGASMRSEQLKALSLVIHEKSTSNEIGDLLAEVSETAENAPHIREMRQSYQRATRIPAELEGALSQKTSEAQHIWVEARTKQSFVSFAPILQEIVELRREEASCIAQNGQSHYDALLGDYEPGASAAQIKTLFDELQTPLRDLRARIAEKAAPKAISGTFDAQHQMALSEHLISKMGYSRDWSYLAQSVHPFSSGNFDDSRITTRVDANDPFYCIYSTLHEMGHALYEHGIDRDLAYYPAGIYASMGVHESQSRFVENQIGRSRAYMDVLFPAMKDHFGDFGVAGPDELYAAVNSVQNGYIRTEADEVHYNLHVILRFGLEQDLISGDLLVVDLEDEWNRRFQADFDMEVPNAALGVLQDVHWSHGLFGYFPTYTLGNIYAACLAEAMNKAISDLTAQISQDDHNGWRGWMQDHIHRHGRMILADDLITKATGTKPTIKPLINYLNDKFGAIYDL